MTQLDKNIALNLKRIRKSKNMSLDMLAERTGVSKSMLGQIERGKSNPTVSTIGKIVEGLKVPFEQLIYDRKEIMERVSMTKTAAFVLEKMAQTERFCNAQLFGYINDISKEEQSQFSVVCVRLDDKSIYVSFSGTDNTIVGWRENFNMGYLSETPGQLKAVDYLNHMVKEDWKKIRVGGHSKGGNLSVYASVKCDRNIQKRIVKVYSLSLIHI